VLRLAVTLGDPRGVGPEVSAKAVSHFLRVRTDVEVLLLGPEGSGGGPGSFVSVGAWDGSEASAGAVSAAAITRATEMALAGEVAAVVTAPIHKPALRAAGVPEPGHTELLQRLSGADDVGMLMDAESTQWGAPLRVLLATTHLALRDVPAALTTDLLVRQGRLLDRALRTDWGIEGPRIAFCAFNPHASDSGLFGDEEARVYAPALGTLVSEGVGAAGPFPADTVFTRALKGEFDAVVAPYHDVGMAAFKSVTFGSGVNVTLGLPFVRTSPDHGTAFDLAGRGVADEGSMLEALRLAAELAARRLGRGGRHFDSRRAAP
jgi:4-hydroxythreonine-4-phosphate dehydrogenase